MEPPVFHKFVAFSVISSDGNIKPSYAKCNNCGAVHKVTEVNTSERIKKEDSPLVPDVEEIKASLPEKLVGLLVKVTDIHVSLSYTLLYRRWVYGPHSTAEAANNSSSYD